VCVAFSSRQFSRCLRLIQWRLTLLPSHILAYREKRRSCIPKMRVALAINPPPLTLKISGEHTTHNDQEQTPAVTLNSCCFEPGPRRKV